MNTPPSFIDSAFAEPASLAAAARLRVVLVGTQHPGNIGAAARALKTMGLARLVLVAPEDYPAEEAYRRAAGADDLLGDAPVVATLAEAVADCHLVLGCTARSRRRKAQPFTCGRATCPPGRHGGVCKRNGALAQAVPSPGWTMPVCAPGLTSSRLTARPSANASLQAYRPPSAAHCLPWLKSWLKNSRLPNHTHKASAPWPHKT